MKKILIALLAFAIVGGGVFAQGWTFSGWVDGGLGMYFLDGEDDPVIAPLSSAWDQGFSTRLFTQFVNQDGNAGLHFNFRANNPRMGGGTLVAYDEYSNRLNTFFDWAYGWLTFADGMVRVQGGRVNNGFFNGLDRMWGANHGWGLGVFTTVRAVENLYFGFGAFTGDEVLGFAPDLDTDGDNHPQGVFYLSYLMPNLFRVTAGISNATEHPWTNRLSGPAMSGSPGLQSQAHLSFAYLGDPAMHAALTARFRNFEEFGDYGIMNFYATFGHTGLVDNLDLRLGASVGVNMADRVSEVTSRAPHSPDMHLWVWLGAYYALTDSLMPRFDAHFVMGGLAAPGGQMQSLSTDRIRDSETWDSDDMFVQLRPAVRFSITPLAFFEIGGIINIDIGDDGAATWGSKHGVNAAAYALMRVQF